MRKPRRDRNVLNLGRKDKAMLSSSCLGLLNKSFASQTKLDLVDICSSAPATLKSLWIIIAYFKKDQKQN